MISYQFLHSFYEKLSGNEHSKQQYYSQRRNLPMWSGYLTGPQCLCSVSNQQSTRCWCDSEDLHLGSMVAIPWNSNIRHFHASMHSMTYAIPVWQLRLRPANLTNKECARDCYWDWPVDTKLNGCLRLTSCKCVSYPYWSHGEA